MWSRLHVVVKLLTTAVVCSPPSLLKNTPRRGPTLAEAQRASGEADMRRTRHFGIFFLTIFISLVNLGLTGFQGLA